MIANTWISLLSKQKKSGNTKSFSEFRVYALKSKNNTTIGLRVFSTWMSCLTLKRIGGSSIDLHGKSRMIPRHVEHLYELTLVNFDGSSVGQAPREDCEVIL